MKKWELYDRMSGKTGFGEMSEKCQEIFNFVGKMSEKYQGIFK